MYCTCGYRYTYTQTIQDYINFYSLFQTKGQSISLLKRLAHSSLLILKQVTSNYCLLRMLVWISDPFKLVRKFCIRQWLKNSPLPQYPPTISEILVSLRRQGTRSRHKSPSLLSTRNDEQSSVKVTHLRVEDQLNSVHEGLHYFYL